MFNRIVAVVAASAALAGAAPQAISSATSAGTITAVSYIGNSTRDLYPPTGSKYLYVPSCVAD